MLLKLPKSRFKAPQLKQILFEPLEFTYPANTVYGVDEAGRGPLAGPLSFAVAYLPIDYLTSVLQSKALIGLNDSKKIPEKKREILYEEILKSPCIFEHTFLSNRFIDRFGLSIGIYQCVKKLYTKIETPNPFLLIDGNYKFEKKFNEDKTNFPYLSIIKGDSKIASIAVASIIAKVTRDRWMRKFSDKFPEYKFDVHKGYGTELHRNLIKEFGICKIHRKSFLKNEI